MVEKLHGTSGEVLIIFENGKNEYILDLTEYGRSTTLIANKPEVIKFLKDSLEQIQSDQI